MNICIRLLLSAVVVFFINFIQCKNYEFSAKKLALISLSEIVFGILGTMILYFVENRSFAGTSFFGAVFLLPLFMLPISKGMKVSYHEIMSFIAPSGLLMYAVNKVSCYLSDCCSGRIIGYTGNGIPIYFPSQIVETIVTIAISVVLINLANREKQRNVLYPLGMILYGLSRLVLSVYREDFGSMQLVGSYGFLWSMVAVLISCVWLYVIRKQLRLPKSK